jgi:predicted Zn-dependent protease with MMP-like domain
MEPSGIPSIDEVKALLDDIADEIPEAFYRELNGGIILLPDAKTHPVAKDANDLYILGEYHHEYRGLGRFITIYYGSFMRLYPSLNPLQLRRKLKDVLMHEFTHHIESLAGVRNLELKDARDINKYLFGG